MLYNIRGIQTEITHPQMSIKGREYMLKLGDNQRRGLPEFLQLHWQTY